LKFYFEAPLFGKVKGDNISDEKEGEWERKTRKHISYLYYNIIPVWSFPSSLIA
jgi:hypothetical protein